MYDFRDSSDQTTTQAPCPKPRLLLTAPEVARLPIGLPSHLRAHGYRAHGCGLGRNIGLAGMILDCVPADDGERCKSIAVPSSHIGLTPNPITSAVIVGRLAQDPGDITAFGWGTCRPRPVRPGLGRPAAAPEVGPAS